MRLVSTYDALRPGHCILAERSLNTGWIQDILVPEAIRKCRRRYENKQLVERKVKERAKHGLNGATQPIYYKCRKTRWEGISIAPSLRWISYPSTKNRGINVTTLVTQCRHKAGNKRTVRDRSFLPAPIRSDTRSGLSKSQV